MGAQTNQSFWKLNNVPNWSYVSHIIIKGWKFMIKSFSGQVAFVLLSAEPYMLMLAKTDYPSVSN